MPLIGLILVCVGAFIFWLAIPNDGKHLAKRQWWLYGRDAAQIIAAMVTVALGIMLTLS